MLTTLLTIVFVIVCFLLIVIVLLQSGKGGGVSGAFGIGQASQTILGASGTGNFLTRGTTVLGAVFMLLSLMLAVIEQGPRTQARRSLLQSGAPAATAPAAGFPEAPATGGSATPAPAAPASPEAGLPVTTPGTTPATGGGQ
jgi:preprotein translocase subunit SecG